MAEALMAPEFEPFQKYLMYQGGHAGEQSPEAESHARMGQAPLSVLAQIGWSPEGIAEGLNALSEAVQEGRTEQYFVYPKEACGDDPLKAEVNLIRIRPAEAKAGVPVIVLCARGAYESVCTMVEALPTARHFLALGYNVFLFTYRVGVQEAAIKALDDLAAGIRYLDEHSRDLGIAPFRYAIGGFSAGSNLVSNWGSPRIGYQSYGLPKPAAMFPIYTYIDLELEAGRDENGGLVAPMLGRNFRELIPKYNVVNQIDADYPPCYIVCGKDDTVVPCVNSEKMKEKLDEAGVPAVLEEGEHAPHGFGDGTGTDVEGWPERAAAFLEGLI